MTKWHKALVSVTIVTIVASSAAGFESQERTLSDTQTDQPRKAAKSASHAHRPVVIDVTTTAIYGDLIKGVLAGLVQKLTYPEKQRRLDHRATQKALNTLRKASELAVTISNKWIKRPGTYSSQVVADFVRKVMEGAETLRAATYYSSTRPMPPRVVGAGGTKLEKKLAKSTNNDEAV